VAACGYFLVLLQLLADLEEHRTRAILLACSPSTEAGPPPYPPPSTGRMKLTLDTGEINAEFMGWVLGSSLAHPQTTVPNASCAHRAFRHPSGLGSGSGQHGRSVSRDSDSEYGDDVEGDDRKGPGTGQRVLGEGLGNPCLICECALSERLATED
jgi:hypothetical protein